MFHRCERRSFFKASLTVARQVESIHHLDSLRSSCPTGESIRFRPIPNQDSNPRMAFEPLSQRFCISSINDIYGLMALKVDKYGGVGLTTPQRKLVHAKNSGFWNGEVLLTLPSYQRVGVSNIPQVVR